MTSTGMTVEASGPSLMGLPRRSLDALAGEIAVIGVPTATPYAHSGAHSANAPAAIRRAMAHYADALDRHDFDLGGRLIPNGGRAAVDCGDVPVDAQDFAVNRQRIAAAITVCRARGSVPIVLGGDDSVPIPVLAAYAGEGPLSIVQVDAHIDWRHEIGGETLGYSSPMRRASEMSHVGRMVQIGQRGTGSARAAEVADAIAHGVRFIAAAQVHREGIAGAIDAVPAGVPAFVSFDVDVLDPSIAPGVASRSPGGLMFDQALAILHGVAAKAPIAGFALVELVPELDQRDLTALTCGRLVANMIGLMSRQGQRAG